MATNMKRDKGTELSTVASFPATPVSGDPVVYGQRPGVALTAENTGSVTDKTGNAPGYATVKYDGVFLISVKGVDGGGNSAVAGGDILYYVSGDTPPVSKKATGVRFGYAGDGDTGTLVTAGATTTIPVVIGY